MENRKNSFTNKKWLSFILAFVLIVISFTAGFLTSHLNRYSISKEDYEFLKQMAPIKFAYETIQREYYSDIEIDSLIEAAGDGMSGILDRYSTFYSPQDYENVLDSAKGLNYAIGISVIKINGEYLVGNILSGSPAESATEINGACLPGLKPGDKILNINDTEINNTYTLSKVLNLTKSQEEGAEITLFVERNIDGNGSNFSFKCVTEEIADVRCEFYDSTLLNLPSNFAYIKLSAFTGDAYNQFVTCINAFRLNYMQQYENPVLILDLRNNGGGKVSILQKIAAYLIIDKNVKNPVASTQSEVMHVNYKNGETNYFKTADNRYIGNENKNLKIILFVNNNSASASEALVGAVKDWETATVIGTRTFGKGIMQETFYDKDTGYGIKLTTATFHSPITSYCPQDNPFIPDYKPFASDEEEADYINSGIGVSGTSYSEDVYLKYTVDNIDSL